MIATKPCVAGGACAGNIDPLGAFQLLMIVVYARAVCSIQLWRGVEAMKKFINCVDDFLTESSPPDSPPRMPICRASSTATLYLQAARPGSRARKVALAVAGGRFQHEPQLRFRRLRHCLDAACPVGKSSPPTPD